MNVDNAGALARIDESRAAGVSNSESTKFPGPDYYYSERPAGRTTAETLLLELLSSRPKIATGPNAPVWERQWRPHAHTRDRRGRVHRIGARQAHHREHRA